MIDTDTPVRRTVDIPPAFYRDDEPPPPPDDPHWREWWHDDNDEPLSRWIVYGLPAALIIAAAFHTALVLVVLKSIRA